MRRVRWLKDRGIMRAGDESDMFDGVAEQMVRRGLVEYVDEPEEPDRRQMTEGPAQTPEKPKRRRRSRKKEG